MPFRGCVALHAVICYDHDEDWLASQTLFDAAGLPLPEHRDDLLHAITRHAHRNLLLTFDTTV